MKKIDLHIHSNCSDGEKSPKEIIDIAKANNVKVISVADHDTVDAYTDEFYSYAKENNIDIINACEISTKYNGLGIHMLGLNIDVNSEVLKEKLYLNRNSRHIYLHDVSKVLRDLGYIVNEEKLDEIELVTKAHISTDIITNPKNEEILLKEFGKIPSKGEFIEAIMNEGCKAFVDKVTLSPKEVVDLVHNAGGKVLIAHPVAYEVIDGLSKEEIINMIKDINPDGIESNYILINQDGNKINDSEFWSNFAKENKLIESVGSDFHRYDNVHPEIGDIVEILNLSDEYVNEMLRNIMN